MIAAIAVALSPKENVHNGQLALIYFTCALPFFLSGAIVSLAISETIERVDRVYFFDLLGAAAGCLLLVPLLNAFGGPNTTIAAAVTFAAAAAIWHGLAGRISGRAACVALALALFGLLIVNNRYGFIEVRYAKGQKLQKEIFRKWNSFSRIGLAPERGSGMPIDFYRRRCIDRNRQF